MHGIPRPLFAAQSLHQVCFLLSMPRRLGRDHGSHLQRILCCVVRLEVVCHIIRGCGNVWRCWWCGCARDVGRACEAAEARYKQQRRRDQRLHPDRSARFLICLVVSNETILEHENGSLVEYRDGAKQLRRSGVFLVAWLFPWSSDRCCVHAALLSGDQIRTRSDLGALPGASTALTASLSTQL